MDGNVFEPRLPEEMPHDDLVVFTRGLLVVAWLQAEQLYLLSEQNRRLSEQNAALTARVAELERELGRHSGNSSKPPSADTVTQRKQQHSGQPKRIGGGKPGKRKGSKGHHLEQVNDPDVMVTHLPHACEDCGASLEAAEIVGRIHRQVFEVPEPRMVVTEHVAEQRLCPCGCVTTAIFPDGVTAPAVYGPNVKAFAVYLLVGQHLPFERCAQTMADLFGVAVSTGTLAAITEEVADALAPFVILLVKLLVAAPVAHFDETGCRVNGDRWWVHVASTLGLSYLFVHDRRGIDAFDDMAVLPYFDGVAVHDGWKPYWHYACEHAQCLAHHIRTMRGIAEVAAQAAWAEAMVDVLFEMRSAVTDAFADGQTALAPSVLHSFRIRYGRLVQAGYRQNPDPPPGRKRNKLEADAYNELRRLDRDRNEILRFLTDFRVPFTNNQAERDVRMIKLQDKISGGWRSPDGARRWATTRSYIQTCRKQGINILDALKQAIAHDPWLPPATT